LLGNARIKARVAELRAERAQRVQITQDDVLLRLIELGFSNMGDYVQVLDSGDPVHDFTKLDRSKWGAVQELTVDRYSEGRGEDAREVKRVKFKLYDPRGAVVDVGKHLGMWPNRIEHTGKDGGPIEVAELTETERAAKATALIQTALKRAEAAKSGGKAKKR
jgi:phage terminase small subunit